MKALVRRRKTGKIGNGLYLHVDFWRIGARIGTRDGQF